MEFLKIVLLFFIFIACTLSHRPVETEKERQTAIREPDSGLKSNRPAKNKENCNRKSCWQNKVLINEQCTCFPLNSYNIPVPRYVLNDPRELLARTVVYIYTVGNKSSIYIPNLEKQSRFIDLTFDDGDIFKPLSSQNAKLLLAQDTELSEVKNENRRPNILENEIINQPVSIHNVKKLDLPINSEDINREALKDILEGHVDMVVQNNWPPSQGYFDQHGPSNPIHIDKPQSVFNPDEYEYDNFRKPKPIIISKPRDKNVISQNPNANIDVPYDFAESTFENIGLNPNEHEKNFVQEEFELTELNTHDLNPITQDKQVYNKPLVISGLSPNNKDKHSHQPERPLSFEPKPSEKNVNVLDIDLSSSIIPKPANGDEFYINSFPQPQKNFELEISENQLPSDNLYKSNIKCSSGICKLYIYCSRNDCPKYLQSLAQLHTTIHKHPLMDNTYVAINNARANESDADLRLRPIPNLIGLEDADEEVQNIRLSGDQNPLHLLTQPSPRSIPINFNPLSNILDQGQIVQNLVPVNQHQQRQVEYYPMNNPILSTQYRDSPYSRDIIIPRSVNDKYNRRNYGLTSKNEGSFLKELLLLPSEIHHKGMRKMADLLPDLGLRKNDVDDVDVEEIETPVDEDDIKIKIVGGKPAISSGTPMQIKARLGDIV